jgi:hypothetical protein
MAGRLGLPPVVDGYTEDGVRWRGLERFDFATLGYFLGCHLIIEHYLDHFLAEFWPDFQWADAKLTFPQKVALISELKMLGKYNFTPSLKHMNSLRNRIAHTLQPRLSRADLQPFQAALRPHVEKSAKMPRSARKVLSMYTALVCSWFAGALSGRRQGSSARKPVPA